MNFKLANIVSFCTPWPHQHSVTMLYMLDILRETWLDIQLGCPYTSICVHKWRHSHLSTLWASAWRAGNLTHSPVSHHAIHGQLAVRDTFIYCMMSNLKDLMSCLILMKYHPLRRWSKEFEQSPWIYDCWEQWCVGSSKPIIRRTKYICTINLPF